MRVPGAGYQPTGEGPKGPPPDQGSSAAPSVLRLHHEGAALLQRKNLRLIAALREVRCTLRAHPAEHARAISEALAVIDEALA